MFPVDRDTETETETETESQMNLAAAKVVGYFSLPSAALAEHNPTAYQLAMAGAPAGAGTCAHCGTGILHHVVVRLPSGEQAFIGSECASKIGGDVARCSRMRLTAEQIEARDAEQAAQTDRWNKQQEVERVRRAERCSKFADALTVLRGSGEFHQSLAEQLERGSLTDRQARYAVTAVVGRQTKRNSIEWEKLFEAMTQEEATV